MERSDLLDGFGQFLAAKTPDLVKDKILKIWAVAWKLTEAEVEYAQSLITRTKCTASVGKQSALDIYCALCNEHYDHLIYDETILGHLKKYLAEAEILEEAQAIGMASLDVRSTSS